MDYPDAESSDHLAEILFPPSISLASPGVRFLEAPHGSSRLATRDDFSSFSEHALDRPEEFRRILAAYAVAHDDDSCPSLYSFGDGLPFPMENILVVGPPRSGKTSRVTLPLVHDAIRHGNDVVFCHGRGETVTDLISAYCTSHKVSPDALLIVNRDAQPGRLESVHQRISRRSDSQRIVIIEVQEPNSSNSASASSLSLSEVLRAFEEEACKQPNQCLSRRTSVIINDAELLRALPTLPKILSNCGRRGLSIVLAAQSLWSVSHLIGADARTVLSMFASHVVLGSRRLDTDTAEHYSYKSGGATALFTAPDGLEIELATQIVARRLLLESDIRNVDPHKSLGTPATVFLDQVPPFQAYLTPTHLHGTTLRLQKSVEREAHSKLSVASPPCETTSSSGEQANLDSMLEGLDRILDAGFDD